MTIRSILIRRNNLLCAALATTLILGAPAGRCADNDGARRLVDHCSPQYPELAKQMRISGRIVLRISVLPDGHVGDVQLESGHPLLVRSAEEAVKRWRYAPGPETTVAKVQVDFNL